MKPSGHGLPSSTMPSPLSSFPLHTSIFGIEISLHTNLPISHLIMPALHTPRPSPHGSPTPGSMPSSISPLQLSSSPLHTSGDGCPAGASHMTPEPSGL